MSNNSNTNRLVPLRQFGHEQAVRRSGLVLSKLSVETDIAVFAEDVPSNKGNS